MAWNDRGFLKAKALRYDLDIPPGRLDPFRLAPKLNVQVIAEPVGNDSPVEGMYVRRGGRGFIFVNSSKPHRRQRLTCAHEIGHHVLIANQEDVQVIEGPGALSRVGTGSDERDAFRFASELLMDERGVREQFGQAPNLRAGIARIVGEYDVSPSSAAIRLSELGLNTDYDTNEFLAEIGDRDGWRTFVTEFGIRQRDVTHNSRQLPTRFLSLARRLREAGVLSDGRFAELIRRPGPTVA